MPSGELLLLVASEAEPTYLPPIGFVAAMSSGWNFSESLNAPGNSGSGVYRAIQGSLGSNVIQEVMLGSPGNNGIEA